ncbi:hypothetical protein PMAYCL1PPCAC_13793, partial [Pristionchus mayeri]
MEVTESSDSSAQQVQPMEDSQQHDNFADDVTGSPSIVSTQHNEGSDSPSDLLMWESLAQRARPAFGKICSYIRADWECIDLANFSKVSSHYQTGVIKFMGRENN